MYHTEVAWAQILGSRAGQQDRAATISWSNGFRLLLLADGMGGHGGGDVASRCVVQHFCDAFTGSDQRDTRQRLLDALDTANGALSEKVKAEPSLAGMGTTLVAAAFDGISLQWVSVGDSPLWLIRDGSIRRLNENHSMSALLAEKVAAGEMRSEDAAASPLRTQLLDAVVGEAFRMLDAPAQPLSLEPGDWVIVASDGLETCAEADILARADQAGSPAARTLVDGLLAAVAGAGRENQDNATVVAMCVSGSVSPGASVATPAGEFTVEPPGTHSAREA